MRKNKLQIGVDIITATTGNGVWATYNHSTKEMFTKTKSGVLNRIPCDIVQGVNLSLEVQKELFPNVWAKVNYINHYEQLKDNPIYSDLVSDFITNQTSTSHVLATP
ncbi:MAG: hypothetical protein WCH62_08120 [Candidatus Omnitrophota bacterium]